jgi:hypothetical protein
MGNEPTNGPYPWGNGPKPDCCHYQAAAKAVKRLKFRLAVRYVRRDIKTRLGMI